MKRANKRKETDADFEEKRFNLSLGQAELDRENDYYTRPASPVYKPDEVIDQYLDPFEKQAIRHFRGGKTRDMFSKVCLKRSCCYSFDLFSM